MTVFPTSFVRAPGPGREMARTLLWMFRLVSAQSSHSSPGPRPAK